MLPKDAFRDAALLDIGGGIGAIQHEAAARGAKAITDVDASAPYLATARSEATTRGYVERAQHLHGDFVELAGTVPRADVVTLDRVVCCYPDATKLLMSAGDRARRYFGLVWPRDRWWTRVLASAGNLILRLMRNPFRAYIHPDGLVDETIRARGFRMRSAKAAGYWQVRVYERVTPDRSSPTSRGPSREARGGGRRGPPPRIPCPLHRFPQVGGP